MAHFYLSVDYNPIKPIYRHCIAFNKYLLSLFLFNTLYTVYLLTTNTAMHKQQYSGMF